MDSQSGVYRGITRSPISYTAQFGYSVGHILNDLCSSCWFTYLIIYLTDVQRKSKDFAGILMLVGQVADGLATPLVAIGIDKINNRYGKRKTWHAIGTICVAIAFGFIFHKCFGCEDASPITQQIYYGGFIILFQFGWACTQISHLSLIPVLTVCKKKIVFLNCIRSGLTFVCGITVYIVMWFLLHSTGTDRESLGPGDALAFSYLSIIVVCTGVTFSLVFHLMVKESTDEELRNQVDEQTIILKAPIVQKTMGDWFKIRRFYLIAVMYMFTRIAVNVPQVYLPLYLTQSLRLPKESIAYYPLMMLIFSVIGSIICRVVVKCIGKRPTYLFGATLVVGSAFWFQFQTDASQCGAICTTYGATALIGAGSSIMLIMSLSMTADLISIHTETGAFVYGAMSLLDKISNGIVIALLQHFHPDTCQVTHCAIADYYRYVMSLVPGCAAVCGSIATLIIAIMVYMASPTKTSALAKYVQIDDNRGLEVITNGGVEQANSESSAYSG